jgi:hypothetical protein
MRLLALAGDIGALIAQIRLVEPLKELCKQQGWALSLKSFHDCTGADLAAAEVLIVQRGASARVLRLQQRMRQLGGAVVYEIDDLLTDIAPHISNQAAVRHRRVALQRCMAEADAVTVSTARLGHELGLPHAWVVPNHGLAMDGMSMPPQRVGQVVNLLFASSDNLAADFIYPALLGMKGVRVVVVGPPAAAFVQAGIAVQAQPLLPRTEFQRFAHGLSNPLAVIPLENSRFAACKSAIKWFDYAQAGVPALCSDVSPYAEVITDGVTAAMVPNRAEDWRVAIEAAVADAGWRGQVAQAARREVQALHTLDHTVAAWRQAIEAASLHRRSVTLARPAWGQRLQQGIALATQDWLLRLRKLNRDRLARRSRR